MWVGRAPFSKGRLTRTRYGCTLGAQSVKEALDLDGELVEAACTATAALTQLSAVQRAQLGSAPHLEAPEHLGDEHFKIGPPTTRRRGDARLREITQVDVLASGGGENVAEVVC